MSLISILDYFYGIYILDYNYPLSPCFRDLALTIKMILVNIRQLPYIQLILKYILDILSY